VTLCSEICGINLSTGFHKEHSSDEYLDIAEWQGTLALCQRWLAEENLPRFPLKNGGFHESD
jgi:hypothetical protein